MILHCLLLRDLFQGFFLLPDSLVQIRHTLLNLLLNTADIEKAAAALLDRGVEQVYISLSGDGLYAADRQGHSVRLPCPKVQVANATGGGDAMAAALAACIAHGRPLAECARMAAGAGALACTASETIHPGMSWESIEYIVNTAK